PQPAPLRPVGTEMDEQSRQYLESPASGEPSPRAHRPQFFPIPELCLPAGRLGQPPLVDQQHLPPLASRQLELRLEPSLAPAALPLPGIPLPPRRLPPCPFGDWRCDCLGPGRVDPW